MKCKHPDCDEEVVQTGTGRPRLFHSEECRKDYWDASIAERKRTGARGNDHKLTDIDVSARTATCAQCGPGTPIYKGGNRGTGRWRCANRVNAQPSRIDPKPHSDPIQYRLVKLRSRGIRLTREQYLALVKRADGRCELCGRVLKDLCFDHCHTTSEARGHLCSRCNTGLGKLGDREGLVRALAYLDMAEVWLTEFRKATP